ncbi:hypothetical protein VST7929_01702 [Vibrio stylophorae]|uniref:DUF2799 domain-containing protein n=1 Tax=Vibrio stylophorae TaxID=659351 RepID=A0ABM8ZU33_9VIBR|nr:DUF2799 domain-containing protein [Vibrio stylophorae]CAH0533827.1 hypothetical protein VST7929_01702 [Vibrio stylophorae]
MKLKRCVYLGSALMLLSSCATMNQQECLTANWQQIGLADGANGYRISQIDAHRQACAEYGVTPDLQAYTLGYQQGLKAYCAPANGYQVGYEGKAYYGQCPEAQHAAFFAAYQNGAKHFELRSEIQRLENEYESDGRALTDLNNKIDQATLQYQIFEGSAAELRAIGLKLEQLKQQRFELLYQRAQAQRDIDARQAQLSALPLPQF